MRLDVDLHDENHTRNVIEGTKNLAIDGLVAKVTSRIICVLFVWLLEYTYIEFFCLFFLELGDIKYLSPFTYFKQLTLL